jgi:hypothetical protein
MIRHRHRAAAVSSLGLAASLPLLALAISACSAGPANARPPAAALPAGVSVPAARFASSASIWFEPQAPGMNGPFGEVGSVDYLALFRPGAPWPRVLARVQAVGFTADWLYSQSDQVLAPIVAFLNAHKTGIEIEAPALQALPACGSGVEGYVPYGLPGGLDLRTFTLGYLQKLKALGAHLMFLKVDEPYYFGSVVSAAVLARIAQAADDPNTPVSCHFPVAEVARDVGQFARLVHAIYPDAQIGDVEPVRPGTYQPDAVTALDAWHETYKSVTGAPFPFFFADVDYDDPGWPALVKKLEVGTSQLGIRFGIIYIGDMQDISDTQWTSQVQDRFEQYQRQAGGRPDYVLFQSWQPRPTWCLPETNPTTFTGVINTYITATQRRGPPSDS